MDRNSSADKLTATRFMINMGWKYWGWNGVIVLPLSASVQIRHSARTRFLRRASSYYSAASAIKGRADHPPRLIVSSFSLPVRGITFALLCLATRSVSSLVQRAELDVLARFFPRQEIRPPAEDISTAQEKYCDGNVSDHTMAGFKWRCWTRS